MRGRGAGAGTLFGGKLQISGNVLASQKLEFLQTIDPALVLEVTRERLAGGTGAAVEEGAETERGEEVATEEGSRPRDEARSEGPSVAEIMPRVDDYLRRHPAARAALGTQLQLRVGDPATEWWVSSEALSSAPPQANAEGGQGDREGAANAPAAGNFAGAGHAPAAAATLILSAADLGAIVLGRETLRSLFMQGRLEVDGDPRLARGLSFLEGLWDR